AIICFVSVIPTNHADRRNAPRNIRAQCGSLCGSLQRPGEGRFLTRRAGLGHGAGNVTIDRRDHREAATAALAQVAFVKILLGANCTSQDCTLDAALDVRFVPEMVVFSPARRGGETSVLSDSLSKPL
ncbi:MAG TPA: hypothetical protein VFT22_32130, partial [Kofleriaceae bacterium]|nr:hypothetical protein [Kofleriaceae bacterium]